MLQLKGLSECLVPWMNVLVKVKPEQSPSQMKLTVILPRSAELSKEESVADV